MTKRHLRRRASALLAACCTFVVPVALLAPAARADTLVDHADAGATGWYPDQPDLSPATVTGGTFGQLFSSSVVGQVYAQPLVDENTLLVATEADEAYGLDPRDGSQRWNTHLGTPWNSSAIGCADLAPTIGVTGTPVVDDASDTEYLLAKTALPGDATKAAYAMHALDVATGQERPGFPVAITGNATNAPNVTFDATYELQRPGLLLLNGVVYAAFGGHCDRPPYTGWVFGVSTAGQITTRWTSQESGASGSGIWQSGGPLLADGPDTIILATGNGNLIPTGPTLGSQPPADLSEAVVRLTVQPDGSLKPVDFFTPYEAPWMDKADADFGSGGPVALPESYNGTPLFGTAAHPHLMLEEGKEGYVYLLDRDNLGGYRAGIAGSDAALSRVGPYGGVWSTPAVFGGGGGYVYIVHGTGAPTSHTGYLRAYQYTLDANGSPTLAMVAQSTDAFGFGSGAPVVTSDGVDPSSALVWMVWQPDGTGVGAQLRAYSALPVSGQMQLVWSAPIGTGVKFAPPAVSGNRVYVGTRDGHVLAFGSPVAEPLEPQPSSVFFGDTIIGQQATQTLSFHATQPITLDALTSSDPQFSLGEPSQPLPAVLNPGDALTVPVTFAPATRALISAAVTATVDGGPNERVAVAGVGQLATGDLVASPSQVSLGGAALGGSPITATLQFSNAGATAIHVTGVSVPPASTNITVTGLPANGATIAPGATIAATVTFTPASIGLFSGSVTLDTDAPEPGTASVTVPVTASAAPPAHLVVSSSAIAFGNVRAGTTTTRAVTLTNVGGTMMTITKSKPPASNVGFRAISRFDEGTGIPPGQSVVLTVSFHATALGHYTDTWVINGDDDTGLHTLTFDAYTALPRSTYWLLDRAGHVYSKGGPTFGEPKLPSGVHALVIVPTPTGNGYAVLDDRGDVFSFGDAPHFGGVVPARLRPGERVATMSLTPSGRGYWVFTTAGRVFNFGDAPWVGDMRTRRLNRPIIASVATASGQGYYMIGSDGGVFGFGDARFYGSTGSLRLVKPVVGIVPTATGHGYWLVAADGGVFGYGDAHFRGSAARVHLAAPIAAMVRYGNGYLMVAADGGVFDFSNAPFVGSLADRRLAVPVVSVGAYSV